MILPPCCSSIRLCAQERRCRQVVVGYRATIHPETIDGNSVCRRLFWIVLVRAHEKRGAGYPHHVFHSGFSLRLSLAVDNGTDQSSEMRHLFPRTIQTATRKGCRYFGGSRSWGEMLHLRTTSAQEHFARGIQTRQAELFAVLRPCDQQPVIGL